MFEFYIAAREQKKQVTWDLLPTKTQHHNICNLFITDLPVVCRNGAGWWVCQAAMGALQSKSRSHCRGLKRPLLNNQHNTISSKNSHSPSSNPSRRKMTQASRLRMPPSSEDEENTVEESEEKAGLRERVKNALNELER